MINILEKLQKTKLIAEWFKNISIEKRNKIIKEIWDSILKNKNIIQIENKKDLENLSQNDPMYDRLLLNDSWIISMSKSCYDLVKIDDPLLKYSNDKALKTNESITIKKVGIPIWVVACIYESRPNVTVDIAIMCIKSSNWVILKWWKIAKNSNLILIKIIEDVLINNDINLDLIYNFPLDRKYLDVLYNAIWLVDVIIPRGWKKLIESVRCNSKVPIIETWAGVVHLYLDNEINSLNREKAIDVIVNAKTNRVSVCNSLDTLIINKNTNKDLIKMLFKKLINKWVTFWIINSQKKYIENYVDNYSIINNNSFYDEQLSINLNIIYVDSINEAMDHISTYSSNHSDWILSDNQNKINQFIKNIDSSVLYTNTSTRFSDWSCFWFAWEIWISTQKLHARWPMWADSLISYKYLISSDWEIRD